MLENLIGVTKCEICGGALKLDAKATVLDYAFVMDISANNIFDKIESIVGKYLVYSCMSCGYSYKYTYKELEKFLRKQLTEQFLLAVVHGDVRKNPALTDKYFVYCGKCSGYDGQGACPKTIFNNCKIKRFPTNDI